MRIVLLLLLLCYLPVPLPAQEYSYVHYEVKDGLAGSVVYHMVQDQDGFIWFATETGVSRFDGTRFKNFTTDDGLPDNEIIRLYVDSKNRVWFIPFKNAVCYYWKGRIHNQENDSLLKKLSLKSEVVSIQENGKGEIAVLGKRELIILKPDSSITVISKYNSQPVREGSVVGLTDRQIFKVGFSTDETLGMFEVRSDTLRRLSRFTFFAPNSRGHYSYYLSPDLEILISFDSIVVHRPLVGTGFNLRIPQDLLSIIRLNDSIICISSFEGAQFYNIIQKKFTDTYLKGNNISYVMEDREGNTWFSSLDDGVFRLASSVFKNHVFKSGNNAFPVLSLTKYGNHLYAGSVHNFLYKVNVKDGSCSSRKLLDGFNAGRVNTVNALDNDNVMWGTDMGFFAISGETVKKTNGYLTVKSVWVDSGTILVGTRTGVFILDESTLQVVDKIWNGRVTSVYQQNHHVYIGTLNGLHVLDSGKHSMYLGNLHYGLRQRIAAMCTGADGTLWIATYGDGVIGYRNGQVTAVLNRDSGLTSNNCRSLFASGDVLWVGTDRGLNKVEYYQGSYHAVNYTVADGLIADLINAIYADRDTVYVGTSKGITYFRLAGVQTRSMCVLRVTGIQTPDRQWAFDTSGLELGHYENDVRIQYSGISFKSGNAMTYRYRLLGLDDNWKQTNDNYLNYQSLPSGQYTLQLLAINKFGIESEMVQLSFTIEKLLWEKNGFRLLAILLTGAAIWLFVRQRIKKVRKEEFIKSETSRKMIELEQMALKAQMNPHFIFNCLHSIQDYVMDKDVRGANKFITDFSRLIRLTLEISARSKISLQEEAEYLTTYLELEKTRFEGEFSYRVTVAENLAAASSYIPPMILQPYIENSIRHGVRYRSDNKGMITVAFRVVDGYLVCTVEDNGLGREVAGRYKGRHNIEYQSRGMSLTDRRIKMLNLEYEKPVFIDIEDIFEADNITSRGTRVIVRFPLQEVKKPL